MAASLIPEPQIVRFAKVPARKRQNHQPKGVNECLYVPPTPHGPCPCVLFRALIRHFPPSPVSCTLLHLVLTLLDVLHVTSKILEWSTLSATRVLLRRGPWGPQSADHDTMAKRQHDFPAVNTKCLTVESTDNASLSGVCIYICVYICIYIIYEDCKRLTPELPERPAHNVALFAGSAGSFRVKASVLFSKFASH
ncbi:hypothetical protein GDO81_020176 [Engystomops pustulosus]|uniref:Uncharacterized protein n=1 Tax=Engystomops pustulosus TaxID=76066 RepID=A0AAV6Z8K8_ENGPU|nr:hypothetical protein GDO81_020176 [Engystomops pustulosus]